MVVTMTYPLWSGINSHTLDDVEINGAAPTPGIVFEGVSTAVIPVLMGSAPGSDFEVVYARHEQRRQHVLSELRHSLILAEPRHITALPEVRYGFGSDRSHKTYPFRRVK